VETWEEGNNLESLGDKIALTALALAVAEGLDLSKGQLKHDAKEWLFFSTWRGIACYFATLLTLAAGSMWTKSFPKHYWTWVATLLVIYGTVSAISAYYKNRFYDHDDFIIAAIPAILPISATIWLITTLS